MTTKIYSTPNCKFCIKAKEFFAEHGVEFEEVDVSEDRQVVEDISGQRGVPVIVVDEQVIVGYNENALREIYGV